MEPLFNDNSERKRKGMKESVEYKTKFIKSHVIPKLNADGYDAEFIRGMKVHEFIPPSTLVKMSENFRKFTEDGIGQFLRFYPTDAVQSYQLLACFFADRTRYIGQIPRYDFTKDIVDTIPEKERIEQVWSMLQTMNLNFLVLTFTGWYWLGKFSDIPVEGYGLTYRNKKNRQDRMYVLPKYQLRKMKSPKHFKDDLDTLFNK